MPAPALQSTLPSEIGEWLDRFTAGLAAAVERRKLWFLGCFSALYFLRTFLLARSRPMWYDELYTFHTARLPRASDIWTALAGGLDLLPPLSFFATRVCHHLFGATEVSTRLPEIVGFWVLSLCLFQFVSRRSDALYGAVAALFPFATGAYRYAYEARPYGIVLGCCGLSLLFWQSAASSVRRNWALPGLALSLAAALSSHYYGVLLLLPLAVGELVRTVSRKRVDWAVWLALAASLLPLLFFLPLIRGARAYSAGFWSRPHFSSIADSYAFLLFPTIRFAVLALVCAAVLALLNGGAGNSRASGRRGAFRAHEIAAALGLALFPVAALTAAFLTGAFALRYTLPAVAGFSILVAFLACRADRRQGVAGAVLFLILFGWFTGGAANLAAKAVAGRAGRAPASEDLATADPLLASLAGPDLPVVSSDALRFLQWSHYGPPSLTSRLFYLHDLPAAVRFTGSDSLDRELVNLRHWVPVNVEDYNLFVASHRRFLLYQCADQPLAWVISRLLADGQSVRLQASHAGCSLYLVTVER
ncbi:MAG TPA: glycosyltransferase family 39 protein [Bryobacterales bacterium]|nr:glycosyltransferase family 39 protein [Bryobacterales bacterium]